MSSQLIPVVSRPIGTATTPTVNARELHAFLEVKSAFKDWIARRIEDFGFIENQDFCSFLSESIGGRPSKEYALTLSMGKELSMVERNAKGKQARQYFIECERIAKDPIAMLNDPATLKSLLLDNLEKVITLQAENATLAPKAAIADRIAASDDLFGFRQTAKITKQNENKLRNWLIQSEWIYYLGKRMTATAKAIKKGWLEVKMKELPREVGEETRLVPEMYFTAKGIHKLAEIFNVEIDGVTI